MAAKNKTKAKGNIGKNALKLVLGIGAGVGVGRGLDALKKAKFMQQDDATKKNWKPVIADGAVALITGAGSVFFGSNDVVAAPMIAAAAVAADKAVADGIAASKGLKGLGADPFYLYEEYNEMKGTEEINVNGADGSASADTSAVSFNVT